MSIFKYIDVWDYLAVILFLFSAWLAFVGTPKIKAMDPEKVDEKSLKLRAYGAMAVSVAYLAVHFYLVE